jgi:hypothetical protein
MRLKVREKGMLKRFFSQALDLPRGGSWIRCIVSDPLGTTPNPSSLNTPLGSLVCLCTPLGSTATADTRRMPICLQQTPRGALRADAMLPASRDWAVKACALVHVLATASIAMILRFFILAPASQRTDLGRGGRRKGRNKELA